MRRTLACGWLGALLLAGCCVTGPVQDNPLVVRPAAKADCADNPVYVPFNSAPASYAALFEKVLDVMSDSGFEIAYSNRYDGRIETFPKISPGVEQPWKPGSPDFNQRLSPPSRPSAIAAIVVISPANDCGYFVDVKVFKELEDLATAAARPPPAPPASAATPPSNASTKSWRSISSRRDGFPSAATCSWNR